MRLKCLAGCLIVFAATHSVPSLAPAQEVVRPGYDLFETAPGETDLLGIELIGKPLVPPLFEFVAPPNTADGVLSIGSTDTIVHRLEEASASSAPGTADPIAIELVALSLQSVGPIVVHPSLPPQRLFVTLQKDRGPATELRLNLDTDPPLEMEVLPGPRSFGEMGITFQSSAGGTFDSQFNIFIDVRLEDGTIVCGGPLLPACEPDPSGPTLESFDGGLSLWSNNSAWSRTPLPDSIRILGVNHELGGPGNTSQDFWGGIEPSGVSCVRHGGLDARGLPTQHVTCPSSCAAQPPDCTNGVDDDCDGLIDECDEDLVGPVITAPPDLVLACPQQEELLHPALLGFATGVDPCPSSCGPQVDLRWQDFVTPRCGQTFVIDRIWSGTNACGIESAMPELQRIEVVDTIAPIIECPPDAKPLWTVDLSAAGVGAATGTDVCSEVMIDFADSEVLGICKSRFITRTWSATDECGLVSTCVQLIDVRGPADAVQDLLDDVIRLDLGNRSLISHLEAAKASICRTNPRSERPAIGQLEAFQHAARARLDAETSCDLLLRAQEIIDAIREGGTCTDGCE